MITIDEEKLKKENKTFKELLLLQSTEALKEIFPENYQEFHIYYALVGPSEVLWERDMNKVKGPIKIGNYGKKFEVDLREPGKMKVLLTTPVDWTRLKLVDGCYELKKGME